MNAIYQERGSPRFFIDAPVHPFPARMGVDLMLSLLHGGTWDQVARKDLPGDIVQRLREAPLNTVVDLALVMEGQV